MRFTSKQVVEEIAADLPDAGIGISPFSDRVEIKCDPSALASVCDWIHNRAGFVWGGLFVEERNDGWQLLYCFYGDASGGQIHVLLRLPPERPSVPSISGPVHAADWHEREAEDLFGIKFEGHPRLGDFILHDEIWREDFWPMRHSFDIAVSSDGHQESQEWHPHRILQDPGAFAFTVGPIFSGAEESVHFLLESVGEDVTRTIPRLFFKYRGIEKVAETKPAGDVLLLAERFAATTAFSHAFAYCQAIERITETKIGPRARKLRVFFAELERIRHHIGSIEAICESTALAVATAQAGILEEDLLRLSAMISGHRYLFGMCIPGGLSRDVDTIVCEQALEATERVIKKLLELEELLKYSGSFLDRLEDVGGISTEKAREIGLVGPVARASGVVQDLRKFQPYSGYETLEFETPCEKEGDGYARLRLLFAECTQSLLLMKHSFEAIPQEEVRTSILYRAGAALGWAEHPRGAGFHFVRIDANGIVQRYHIVPPSFANWLGFHLAAENFAFQDFPIILATFNLSVAENDR